MSVQKESVEWKESFPYQVEQLKLAKNRGRLRLNAVMGKQGDFFVVYNPSLNISGYGDTKHEAKTHFVECLMSFVEDMLDLTDAQRIKYLRELGWEKVKIVRKQFAKVFDNNKDQFKDLDKPQILAIETAA